MKLNSKVVALTTCGTTPISIENCKEKLRRTYFHLPLVDRIPRISRNSKKTKRRSW